MWEVFLVDKLRFSWDEVHEIAEQLEHIKSKKLTRELDAFLGLPTEDPHGDPIPDAMGNMPSSQKLLLAKVKQLQRCICVGVKTQRQNFTVFRQAQNCFGD